jgi:hypothetical protein
MQELIDELSSLAGVPVELIEPSPGLWIAAPADRSLLRSKLWRTLKVGPRAGVAPTQVAACLLLARALGVAGVRGVTKQDRAKAWLKRAAAGVAMTASEIKVAGEAQGLPWSTVDRAARELGIQRVKCGVEGPWVWVLR